MPSACTYILRIKYVHPIKKISFSTYVQTEHIYFEYTAVAYLYYHSLYISVFTAYYPSKTVARYSNTIIIAVCTAVTAFAVVALLVFYCVWFETGIKRVSNRNQIMKNMKISKLRIPFHTYHIALNQAKKIMKFPVLKPISFAQWNKHD